MATSAKRFGLEVQGDLELELRLRRIEQRIDELSGSSDFGTSNQTQRVTTIPLVTGLRITGSTPGATTVAWNQVRISNLRRYELEIAEDLAFSVNKQSFNVAGTEFQFSTLSSTGGAGGTTIFARVRARATNGDVGAFSVVLNTATGQAQTADIADASVTEGKTSTGALPPAIAASDASKYVRVNSAGNALEYAYTLPTTPAASKLLVGDGANVGQTAWTVPSSLVANKLLIGSGTNLAQTSYTFPTAATVDSVIVGDGTNFGLQDQNPTDDAATDTTSNSNRKGTLTLAGGFQLTWDTIDVPTGAGGTTVGGFTALRTVMAVAAEGVEALRARVSVANTTLELSHGDPGSVEVTYWAIEEV